VVCAFVGLGKGVRTAVEALGASGSTVSLQEATVLGTDASLRSYLGLDSNAFTAQLLSTSDPCHVAKKLAGRSLTRCRELVLNGLAVDASPTMVLDSDRSCVGLGLVAHESSLIAAAWNCARIGWLDLASVSDPGTALLHLAVQASSRAFQKNEGFTTDAGAVQWLHFDDVMSRVGNAEQLVVLTAGGDILLQRDLQTTRHTFCILSGSFNPLHRGHVGLGQAAAQLLAERGESHEPIFEFTLRNPDKGTVNMDSLLTRCSQFAGRYSVAVTSASLFTEKAPLLPGSAFVTGMDTAVRVLDLKYYQNDPTVLQEALRAIEANQCRFVVCGRATSDGFLGADELQVPEGFSDVFVDMPREAFEANISSTELRASATRVAVR